MNQIERITHMEHILTRAADALAALPASSEQLKAMMPQIEELQAYYTSPLWLNDFDDDRAGKIPEDLPRGVLSEDAVYNLLCDLNELKKELSI